MIYEGQARAHSSPGRSGPPTAWCGQSSGTWAAEGHGVGEGEGEDPGGDPGLLVLGDPAGEEGEGGGLLRGVPPVPLQHLQGGRGDGAVDVDVVVELLVEGQVVVGGIGPHAGLEKVGDVDRDDEDVEADQALHRDVIDLHTEGTQLLDEQEDLHDEEAEGHEAGLVAGPWLVVEHPPGWHLPEQHHGQAGQLTRSTH